MAKLNDETRIGSVRRFNRFYTQRIGVLQEGLLDSPFSLTQVRVMYELAHRDAPTAAELGKDLGLDAGYLSRIVRGFQKQGLLAKSASTRDRRQSHLRLTAKGHKAFTPLDRRSRDEVAGMLAKLSGTQRNHLIGAMATIGDLLDAPKEKPASYLLRPHQAGDIGWVIHRHGVLYGRDCGYDQQFEALVAQIAGKILANFDAKRERSWIAEKDGEIVGSVFLVKQSATVAKLRLLLVEPSARGLGIGARLVDECVRFARAAGYRKLILWTQSELVSARRLYQQAGFSLLREESHRSWGKDLVSEVWQLKL